MPAVSRLAQHGFEGDVSEDTSEPPKKRRRLRVPSRDVESTGAEGENPWDKDAGIGSNDRGSRFKKPGCRSKASGQAIRNKLAKQAPISSAAAVETVTRADQLPEYYRRNRMKLEDRGYNEPKVIQARKNPEAQSSEAAEYQAPIEYPSSDEDSLFVRQRLHDEQSGKKRNSAEAPLWSSFEGDEELLAKSAKEFGASLSSSKLSTSATPQPDKLDYRRPTVKSAQSHGTSNSRQPFLEETSSEDEDGIERSTQITATPPGLSHDKSATEDSSWSSESDMAMLRTTSDGPFDCAGNTAWLQFQREDDDSVDTGRKGQSENIEAKAERLESENKALREEVEQLKQQIEGPSGTPVPAAACDKSVAQTRPSMSIEAMRRRIAMFQASWNTSVS
ncbi:hypothetical protein LTR36_003504 [Oleoguttula mirabilis]|uniref:Uncharacterized protein n=1 Tax=Oleoguttula mirabilis TaxID=1507867 RepID=A0AAV9JIT2_9PEZI|nr:hypothetical protein LTR36_003504 [Oleoguttula mirabilis]